MDVILDSPSLKISRLVLSRWQVNSYIIVCPRTGISALVDVPPAASELAEGLEGARPAYILLTHGHIDHVAGLVGLRGRVEAPLAVHPGDRDRLPVQPDLLLADNQVLEIGEVRVRVLFTPGHTPGSVCFLIGEHLLSGDTLFPGGPGRTDTPADFQQIVRSLSEKIFVLPDDTGVYPGHGAFTALKTEKEQFARFASRPLTPGLHGDVSWSQA